MRAAPCRKRCLCCARRAFWSRPALPRQTPRGLCLPRLPVRSNLRPRPSHSRRKRRRSRSRPPTRDLSTLKCRIHATPLRGICRALCRNSTCKTRGDSTTSFKTASSASPCRTRSLWPSKIISRSLLSATTSPSRKPIFSAPRREATSTVSTPASSRPRRVALAPRGAVVAPQPRVRRQAAAVSSLRRSAPARPFNPFDPLLTFSGYVQHTVTPEPNLSQVGVELYKVNNIEVQTQYQQYFPLGTYLQVNYTGFRAANNSPYFAVNPELSSNFNAYLQPAASVRIRPCQQRALHPHRQKKPADHRSRLSAAGHRHRNRHRKPLLGSGQRLSGRAGEDPVVGIRQSDPDRRPETVGACRTFLRCRS